MAEALLRNTSFKVVKNPSTTLNEQMNQSGFVAGRPLNLSGEKPALHFAVSPSHVVAAASPSAGTVLHQGPCRYHSPL